MTRKAAILSAVAAVAAAARPTPEATGDGFDFLSVGDWGDSGAKVIAPIMGEFTPKFVFGIGDNFYNSGVSGVDDPQFKDKFEDTFSAPSLQVPWYICAGNHDYYGGTKGIQAEMDYSKKSSRWKYPSFYFDVHETAADGTTAHILSVDTWRLNGGDTYVDFDPSTNRGALKNASFVKEMLRAGVIDQGTHDILFKNFQPQDPADPVVSKGDTEQLAWIEATLKNSTADWKLVLGHFPVFSSTILEHGDTPSLVTYLAPLLEKYGVDAYFNGHDHILQHIIRNDVHYFGSGAGAKEHNGVNKKYDGLNGYMQGKYGFMAHHVNKTSFTTIFVDQDGKEPYEYTFHKKNV